MSQTEQVHRGTTPVVVVGDYITGLGRGVFTQIQVLKLAFLSHGYALGMTGRPLFKERIEAWKYGPVIPALYEAIREHGNAPIPHLSSCKTSLTSPGLEKRMSELGRLFEPDNMSIVKETVKSYGDFEAFELSSLTHMEGTPWKAAMDRGGCYTPIENAELKSYYAEQLKRKQ